MHNSGPYTSMVVSSGFINLFLVSSHVQIVWTFDDAKNKFRHPDDTQEYKDRNVHVGSLGTGIIQLHNFENLDVHFGSLETKMIHH